MVNAPHRFLGTTQSLCPECRAVVPAKILDRRGRIYFRKRCPTHGLREDFICSDANWYDQLQYTLPAKLPAETGVEAQRGCPLDCGLCEEHEQHTCVAVIEVTDACNLTCPMCYAASEPGRKHLSFEQVRRAIDRFVEVETNPEVMQLSGGEPTVHPEFERIYEYAISTPAQYVMINTNGIRLASDERLLAQLAEHRDRTEIYLQFDGLSHDIYTALRGEPLLEKKLQAVENLGRYDLHTTLVVTLQAGVNENQYGPLLEFAAARPWITSLSFQPATYSGRHVLPEDLERRVTYPDVIKGVARETNGQFRENDFLPLPCAHPNCHQIAYAYRHEGTLLPLTRFFEARKHLDLFANGICFTRPQAKLLVEQYLARLGGCCSGSDCCTPAAGDMVSLETSLPVTPLSTNGETSDTLSAETLRAAEAFYQGVLEERVGASDILRLTITSFLDAYNFDVRRVMKCCTHHVLPSGHVIPFCAYNTLYRDGHVPLPPLKTANSVPA